MSKASYRCAPVAEARKRYKGTQTANSFRVTLKVKRGKRLHPWIALREGGWRVAIRDCPFCQFDMLLVTKGSPGNLLCLCCGLGVPADSIYEIKTNRRVEF